jgi:hypothetical protein
MAGRIHPGCRAVSWLLAPTADCPENTLRQPLLSSGDCQFRNEVDTSLIASVQNSHTKSELATELGPIGRQSTCPLGLPVSKFTQMA